MSALPDRLPAPLPAGARERALGVLERRAQPARRRGWLVRRALLAADLVGLVSAFAAAGQLAGEGAEGIRPTWEVGLFLVVMLPAWVVAARVHGLYDQDEERASHTTADELAGVLHLVTLGVWLLAAASWLSGLARPDLGRLVAFWALAVGLVSLTRAGARGVCRSRASYLQRTVVLGAGAVGQLVARKALQHPEYGIDLLGFVDSRPQPPAGGLERLPVLGPPEALPALVRRLGVERVVVAFTLQAPEEQLELVRTLQTLGVQVDVVPRFFEVVGAGAVVHELEGLTLVGLPPARLSRSSRALKRGLDVALSLAGLTLALPLLALIGALIKLDSRGPVFFRQVRMGNGSRTFRIFKFRTMVADADARKAEVASLNDHLRAGGDARMFKIRRDPRVTRTGRLLRRSSLDELPQLLNVLRGEMSLVGPRPLILDEDRHVTAWARRRLDLKPGITGLWQVLGRSEIAFEEMLRLDYLYVTNWSLVRDVQLLLRTIPALFGRSGGAY